ncbi:MAG: hypothetical protein MUQ26_07935 [Armatimonadetes bacterium]|nr:hypothetical protein [Armatimonadota bacterium]
MRTHQCSVDVGPSHPVEEPYGQDDFGGAALGRPHEAGRADLAGDEEGDLQFGGEPHELDIA